MELSVSKISPGVPGVDPILPGTRKFDDGLKVQYHDIAESVRQLEPYVVLIANRTNRPIVAYSPVFQIERSGNPTVVITPQFKYPNALQWVPGGHLARGRELLPGEQRLAGAEFDIDSTPAYVDWLARLVTSY